MALLKKIVRYLSLNLGLLFRYAVSGGSGVVANLILFSILVDYLHIWYVYGAIIGFVAAYAVTFSMHKWWTFAGTAHHRTVTQGVFYFTSALLGLGLTIGVLHILVDVFGWWPTLAQFIALGVTAVFSFVVTAQITFHADEARGRRLIGWFETMWRHYGVSHAKSWLVLGIVLVAIAAVRLAAMPLTFTSDAVGYAATADLLMGYEVEFNGARYLKPLAPGVIAISTLLGVTTAQAVLVQAVFFYFTLGIAVYWFGCVLFQTRRAGVVLALLIVGSFPIIKYGLDYLTETGAWTLYFMSLAGMVLWYRNPHTKYLWFTALSILAGVLWKEYAVLAGVTLFFVILFQPTQTFRQKVLALIQVAALVCIPWGLWQYHVFATYGYSYIDWLRVGAAPEAYATMYTVPAVIKSLGIIFGIGWLWAIRGGLLYRSWPTTVRYFFACMVLPAFGFLLWGYVSSRLFFSLVPLLAMVAVVGICTRTRNRVQQAILMCYIILNLVLVYISFLPDIRTFLDLFTYGN